MTTRIRKGYDRAMAATPVWLLIVSVTLMVGGIAQTRQNSKTNARTQEAAKAAILQCQRTAKFGPPLAVYFAREQVFSPAVLADFKATLPKGCP